MTRDVQRIVRDATQSNRVVAVFLLVMLLFFTGDNILPDALSYVLPTFDGALPCSFMPTAENLAARQSLIGRESLERTNTTALSLEVYNSGIPADPNGVLSIVIIVENNSIGTIGFVYDEDQVIIGDNNTTGLGIVFTPESNIFTPGLTTRANQTSYPEANIRLLTPRQRCVHRQDIPVGELDASLQSGTALVRAYYRGVGRGQTQQQDPAATPVYFDQGLFEGVITSAPAPVPRLS